MDNPVRFVHLIHSLMQLARPGSLWLCETTLMFPFLPPASACGVCVHVCVRVRVCNVLTCAQLQSHQRDKNTVIASRPVCFSRASLEARVPPAEEIKRCA